MVMKLFYLPIIADCGGSGPVVSLHRHTQAVYSNNFIILLLPDSQTLLHRVLDDECN